MKEYLISDDDTGRLDVYLRHILRAADNGFIYKMLRKKNITVNGKKADGSYRLKSGDSIKIFFSDETFIKMLGTKESESDFENIKSIDYSKLKILYEDKDIIAVNKPINMLSQKSSPKDISLNEIIISYLINTNKITEEVFHLFRPSVVNRLDRNTTGIVICGITKAGLSTLSKAIRDNKIEKYYHCIVHGKIEENRIIEAYHFKNVKNNTVTISYKPLPGYKPIKTGIRVLKGSDEYSLLEIRLFTGRTHQIRAQLSKIGHPLVGDHKYGKKDDKAKYQLLHAHHLILPDGKKIEAKDPKYFEEFV